MENLSSQDLWRNAQGEIVKTIEGYLIFDDTVINKKSATKIDSEAPLKEALVPRQYSGYGKNYLSIKTSIIIQISNI